MNVLIIPEDFRKDQYILKPLFTQAFSASSACALHKLKSVKILCWAELGEALKSDNMMRNR